jgi:hypothetical protein
MYFIVKNIILKLVNVYDFYNKVLANHNLFDKTLGWIVAGIF